MQFRDEWLAEPGFSWKAGYGLASAAKLSYADADEARRVMANVWKVGGRVFRADRTEGLVAEGERSVVVAFRGTQGLADWLSNLDIPPRDSAAFDGEAVHKGFLGAYEAVAHIVEDALDAAPGKTLWFTGHSLGGAIAVVAAATHRARSPAGLVTFGQPRMLSRGAADVIKTAFGPDYVRVVNDNDIVARIPRIYRHAGKLLHFDFAGQLMPVPPTESSDETGDIGPPPVSEAEEEAIEQTARALQVQTVGGALEFEGLEGPAEDSADIAVEGLIPGVPAHRIDNYVQLMRVRALALSETDTFAEDARASLRKRADDSEGGLEGFGLDDFGITGAEDEGDADADFFGDGPPPARSPQAAPAAAPRQPVLLRLRSEVWTPPGNMPVPTRFGHFATALASAADIEALRTDPNVVAIEVSRDAGIEELDSSIPFIGAADLHRPPISERGDQAIVGIIDTGVDILHRAFRNADGSTRLIALWDQRESGGPSPAGHDPAFSQNHGRLYLADELNAIIAAHDAGTVQAPLRLRDLAGHGSHVAGIAAGRAAGALPDGMAPDAPIICVIAGITQGPGEPPSIGYSMSHVDALAFMRRVAQGSTAALAAPMPIAINVSLGMNAGAHDGSTTLEAAFDAITGGGRDPDCVIVKSAGNERGHAGHAKVSVADGLMAELKWTSSARFRDEDYFEAWFADLDDIAFRIVAPSGAATDFVSFAAPETEKDLGGNLCRLHLKELHPDNGQHRLVISIRALPNSIQPGDWTLEMDGRRMASADREVHIWVERTQDRAIRFATQDPEMTLSIPGTARTVIAVGACNSATPIRLNDSSSWGLTRDGRRKPELCAPGLAIRSVKSGDDDHTAETAKSGTSMAAPHVTGALALVMSHRKKAGLPPLNAVQLQSALIRTVRGNPTHHHVGAGYGVLDAGKLFQDLKD